MVTDLHNLDSIWRIPALSTTVTVNCFLHTKKEAEKFLLHLTMLYYNPFPRVTCEDLWKEGILDGGTLEPHQGDVILPPVEFSSLCFLLLHFQISFGS